MAEFTIEIAGHTAAVSSLFGSTKDYCRDYLTGKAPEVCLCVTEDDLRFEQRWLDEEAVEEGFRLRTFSDPFLDRAAVQRKMAEFLFDHHILMTHGSAIAVDGRGYLFTAKSGTGKSTHTRFWRETFGSRAAMINDDKPFIRMEADRIDICGAPWSGKHGLHSNVTVPLAGICILQRGNENCSQPVAAEAALPMLLHQSYRPEAPEKQAAFHRMVTQLATQVPLWSMTCTKDDQAACVAFSAMAGASISKEVSL